MFRLAPQTLGLVMRPARSRTPPVRDAAAYQPPPAEAQLVGAAALCPRRHKSLRGRAGYSRGSRRGGPSRKRGALALGVVFPVRHGQRISRFSKRSAVAGLFAESALKRGVAVGHFTGETLSRAEALRRRTVDSSKSILMFRNADDVEVGLDASVGRRSPWLWVNSSHGAALPASVEFVCVDGERLVVRAIRRVEVGEELLADYPW